MVANKLGIGIKVLSFLLMIAIWPVFSTGTTPSTEEISQPWAWAQLQTNQLESFQSLSQKEQKERAQQAQKLADEVPQLFTAPEMLKQMRQVLELNPSEPLHWLQTAEICREMGYPEGARFALDSGRSLFKGLPKDQRKECIRQYSLTMAWLEYEAGNWAEGEAWGDKAREAEAGLQGCLISALNRSASRIKELKFAISLDCFKPLNDYSSNRAMDFHWAMTMWYHLHLTPFDEARVNSRRLLDPPMDLNRVPRWRDHGMICEINGKKKQALTFYNLSSTAIVGAGGGWLVQKERPIPFWPAGSEQMPFWMNQDGGYVTGSLFGYLEYAFEMMTTTESEERRVFWATTILDKANACMHRYPDLPWTKFWRGAALLSLGMTNDGQDELNGARAEFERTGWKEPRLGPWHGHSLLLKKKYTRAKPLLEQGVKDCPRDARCWGDLGLIYAAEANLEGARHCFDTALSLDRKLAVVWHNRGLLNARVKDWEMALVDMQTAADLAPHDEQLKTDLERVKQKVKLERQK